jgi:hypothetical protein
MSRQADRDVAVRPDRARRLAPPTQAASGSAASGTIPAYWSGMSTRVPLALLPLLAFGCGSYEFANEDATGAYFDTGADALGPSFRLDVYPSGSTSWLSAQSWTPDGDDWQDLDVALSASVLVRGSITGFLSNPTVGGEAPLPAVPGTADAPIVARLDLSQRGGIGAASAWSEDDGSFALRVPGGTAYDLLIAPIDPRALPAQALSLPLLASTTTQQVEMEHGQPVFGRVFAAGGASMEGASVRLQRRYDGLLSEPLTLAADGAFNLRALPGDYDLLVSGESGSVVPSLRVAVEVGEDAGAAVDVDLGTLTDTTVTGTVVDADGNNLRDVSMRVRFTSLGLDGAQGTLQVETEVDGDGFFAKPLLAGQWQAEFIPAYDESLAPTTLQFEMASGSHDLGEVVIPDPVLFSALVTDPSGAPAPDVLVSVRELGYDQNQWSTTTGIDGRFTLSLPPNDVLVTLSPSAGDGAITRHAIDAAAAAAAPPTLSYVGGELVSGTLRSGDEPISYALVELRGEDDTLYATTISDADGAFSARVDWAGAR